MGSERLITYDSIAQWTSASLRRTRVQVRVLLESHNYMPDNLVINHGKTSHPSSERKTCEKCKRVDKWFEEEVTKAGGIDKLIENISMDS